MKVDNKQVLLLCLSLFGMSACGVYSPDEGESPATLPANSGGGVDPVSGLAAFSQTTYPILTERCASCHGGAGPGTPAISHADPSTAYNATIDNQKVNLASPNDSRLVQRLVADLHYCWSSCALDGAEMRESIEAWSTLVGDSGGGTSVANLVSGTRVFADGTEEIAGERYLTGLVSLYEFKEGTGVVARDTSGASPAMDLELGSDVTWMPNSGLNFTAGRAIASAATSRKLYDRIADPETGSGQYALEAWVTPANTDQDGPARIASYSRGTGTRNFTLGQVLSYYDFRNRSLAEGISSNGKPSLETNNDDDDLQAALQHVVMTFDRYRGRRIYVNGVFTDDADPQGGSLLWNWDPEFKFVLGNETSNNRPWKGQVRLVAVYDHAIPDEAILNNFSTGVGKKLRMRFDVSQWSPGTEVEFSVSELDAYSYLFCEPTILGSGTAGLRVKNMRIQVNDQTPVSGQAFTNLAVVVDPSQPQLSRQCSVIAKDRGTAQDVFQVAFENLGNYSDPVVITNPPPPVDNSVAPPLPIEGVRNFARINDTMASLTGVDPGSGNVLATFQEIEQQLPSGYDLRSFLSSQQVGITKLALEYCDSLVESAGLRDSFFGTTPPFEFTQPVNSAFSDQAKRDIIIDALVDGMIGNALSSQPTRAEVAPVVDTLIDDLTAECATQPCDATRTRDVVKASCAAVLGSAAVSMH